MFGQSAPGVSSRAGGVVFSGVYYNRASSVVPATEDGLRAGAGGVSIGRFGWADSGGSVLNSRVSVSDKQGVVVTQAGDWRRVFWDEVTRTWKIREGMNLTMIESAMGMLVELDGCGSWRDPIYTDPASGRVVAGNPGGLEATPWRLVSPSGPGGLSLITTWNN
jgi:hypothetical protein